jgi:2-methoxy-6-polyprenyl-1,4-benzoquinol methylase
MIQISFVKGDAENLSFENASFNAYIMCFGMKYCQNVDKVFNEAYRVLQPGGKILHLELNQVENKVAKWSVTCLLTDINKIIALKAIQPVQ